MTWVDCSRIPPSQMNSQVRFLNDRNDLISNLRPVLKSAFPKTSASRLQAPLAVLEVERRLLFIGPSNHRRR